MSHLNSWVKEQERVSTAKYAVNITIDRMERLFKLTKEEQVKILEGLGIEEIPRYEYQRVILIMKKEQS